MPSTKFFLYKRSNGYWYVGYIEDGRKRWKSTGATLKPDALHFLSEFRANLRERMPAVLFSDFTTQFKATQTHSLRQSTLERIYSPAFDAFLKICGNKALSAYTLRDVEAFKNAMLDGRSATYVNILFRSLRAAFNLALRWRIIPQNPFSESSTVKIPEKTPAHFTKEQFRAFLAAVKEPVLKDLFAFAVVTGLRQGEILSLKWSDVDLQRGLLTVQSSGRHLTKTGKLRSIPLSDSAAGILSRRMLVSSGSDLVFHRKGISVGQSYVGHKFKKVVRAVKLDETLHFHSLRHTFATWLVQEGVSLYEIQKLLGHSSIAVTQVYSHLAASQLFQAVSKISLITN
jgi:integrase